VLNELALEQYLKVAEIRVDDQDIHFKIALEYWYLQDIPKTAEHYIKVIEINPEHLQAHLNLISVYERMKNWGKALEEIVIVKRLSQKMNNQQAMKIVENKFKFIEGRMNLTKKDIKRKSEPPFE
jgi:tetratricopeptide (TPR) repeat protein